VAGRPLGRSRKPADRRSRLRSDAALFAGRSSIAFTGFYQGNQDVYVMPAGGGAARRLTFHSDVVENAPVRWVPTTWW